MVAVNTVPCDVDSIRSFPARVSMMRRQWVVSRLADELGARTSSRRLTHGPGRGVGSTRTNRWTGGWPACPSATDSGRDRLLGQAIHVVRPIRVRKLLGSVASRPAKEKRRAACGRTLVPRSASIPSWTRNHSRGRNSRTASLFNQPL